MTILVTGANGQLGNELKQIAKANKTFEFVFHDIDTLDLTDHQSVAKAIKTIEPAFIVNCAAYTAVDKAEEEKDLAYLLNCEVTARLGELAKEHNSRLIHVSTDYVFDGKAHKPYNEECQTNPQSVYGASKLKGEQALFETDAVIVRTSWLYSSFGNNFVKTMLRLGKERDTLKVIFDQVGTPTYAADLASCIYKIIETSHTGQAVPAGVYHYANEGACSWYDFATEIMQQANLKCKVLPIETFEYPLPAPRPHYSILNKKKIKETLKIEIPHWKESLTKCLPLIK
ncbi:MAG: dTDP-4-dehydrorhamnose reductase [Bacteroidales bacterium]|nr:dTDP-4-dehydrorhamnose reductase [Bacteroidales bacterium]